MYYECILSLQKIGRVLKPVEDGEERAVNVNIDSTMNEEDVVEKILKRCA